MKFSRSLRVIAPVAIVALLAAAQGQAASDGAVRLSEPTESTSSYELFGERLPASGEAMGLGELIENSSQYQGGEVLVHTRIAKVCQKKGCFFVATEGAATARITFKDYGFFIPTDSGGKQATLHGVFSRQPVSQAEAEHYAKDLGESGTPNAEDFSYSIVATGIKIFN
ncbi:MAG: DUF4920 domain-containing protein [Xanthomonadales bacterium]|nr:DUF4920 domain-containing protein [Xanthomonadales bacterium]